MHNLAIDVLRSIDPERPYLVSSFEKSITTKPEAAHARPATDLERASARIHAHLNEAVWQRVLPSSSENLDVKIPFTDQPIDNIKFVEAAVADEGKREDILKAYKEWQKAAMKLLREKLAAGTPGPGVGALMAVLGYEECCRRIGIEAGSGKGW